jgi:acyl-CoA thioesterase-1
VAPAGAAPRGTILVYGDSLSAGYGLAQGESWPSLLQQRLKKEGFDYNVVNASISGETSAGGASRIASTLAQGHPAATVLELGANDGLRGLPAAQMRDNLARIIRALQAAGSKVLIVGMRLPPNYGPVYLKDFEGSFTQLAKTYKAAYLPFLLEGVADKPELFQADQLHPIASAQPRVLDNVWGALRPLLAK